MLVLKVSRGGFNIEKLRRRFCGCTVTLNDDGNNTLIMVDGLTVKLSVEAELRFVETCRTPPSPQPHGGQVQMQPQPQQRGHAQPQQHGYQVQLQRGPAQPQQHGGQVQPQRGHAQQQPQQRGLAQTPRGGHVQPQQKGHVQHQLQHQLQHQPQQRGPVHVAPPIARGGQVHVTHVAHGGESEHSIRRDGNHVHGGAWGCSKSHVPVTNEDGFEWCSQTGGWKC